MNRGNRKALIFEDDRDRRRFVRLLTTTLTEFGVELLCGTLMGNHFHLIVVTPHGNISAFMQQLEGQYAKYYNWRHQRVGHLFQGRFVGVAIDGDLHLFTAVWYVFSNPVEAGLARRPQDWKWSTYAATVGLAPQPAYLTLSWVDALFPSSSCDESRTLLAGCMEDPEPIAAYLRVTDPGVGGPIPSYVNNRVREASQPCACRILLRPPLDHLFPKNQKRAAFCRAVRIAHEGHGYKLAEIGTHVRLHPTTVSKIYRSTRSHNRGLHSGSGTKFSGRWWESGSGTTISGRGRGRGGSRG